MAPSDMKAKPAYMYEEDEEGNPISGTKRSARERDGRHKPSTSHKSRPDEAREARKSKSDSGTKYEPIMSGAKGDVSTEKLSKMERRKSSASTKSPSKSHTRPPSAHDNRTYPKLSIPKDHPAHFGIPTPTSRAHPVVLQHPMAQPIPVRPRAFTAQTFPPRPLSYHAPYAAGGYGTGPPLSASAYYQQPPLPTPSYPPPSPSSSFMRYAATPQSEYFPTQPEYTPQQPISIRPLSQRFGISEPITRTLSAYGARDAPIHQHIQDSYEDGYASASEGPLRRRASIRVPTTRRDSTSRRPETDYDRGAMPPPPRPGILRNRTTEYHPDTSVPDPPMYGERPSVRRTPSTHRTSSSHRNSVSYDLGSESERVRVETANTSHRRRQSYYGQSASTGVGSSGSGWEDKAREATSYQEDVGVSIPLTADALRARQAGSSRSTKSSVSRDDSDYRKSATTRTTRSGSGEDNDFTIKVKGGQARVMVGGAQIDCTEGGEIEIKRQKSIRNGSEHSNSEYGGTPRIDDRRSRLDRPMGRSRRSSVSGHSHARSTPQYPMGQYI